MNTITPVLLYPNAPVMHEGLLWKMVGFRKKNLAIAISIERGSITKFVDIKECQLLLKDLSSITEEDTKELAVIMGTEYKKYDDVSIDFNGYVFLGEDEEYNLASDEFFELPYKAADFLRQGGVKKDCGWILC